MKIAILSRNTKLYSTRRLVEAAAQRGHEAVVYDTLKCYIEVTTMRPGVKYKGERIVEVDAVIPREREHPRAEPDPALAVELGNRPKHLEQDVLRGVLGIFTHPEHAHAQAIDVVLDVLDE